MPFAATWIDLEVIMLSEISQKQILYDIINHMWNLKKTQQTSEHNERHRLTILKIIASFQLRQE